MTGTLPDSPPDGGWQRIEGVDPVSSPFPARARLPSAGGVDRPIVVFRLEGGYRATQGSCPHLQATMAKALVIRDGAMVRCPLHAFTFRLSNGKGVNCPGFRIDVFDIEERQGSLYGRAAP